jgi:hypothetical protein
MSQSELCNKQSSSQAPIIWDSNLPFPDYKTMEDPAVITHVQVERAQQGVYHYLHESAIAWHRGRLFVGYANHPTHEDNIKDELIRGRISDDGGMTFGPTESWINQPQTGACSFNHPVFATKENKLWSFVTRWEKDVTLPRAEIFAFDDKTEKWNPCNANIPTFIPFRPPMKMNDGNWIMGGESFWFDAAVAISHGDDWTQWDLIVIPKRKGLELMFPETALIDQGNQIIAFCRPKTDGPAQVSSSTDFGKTWEDLQDSNFPITSSQPYAGLLSTNQHYLITNHIDQGRALLTLALTEPNGKTFKKMFKIRHQQTPTRRVFTCGKWYDNDTGEVSTFEVGSETEWSYPAAVEHEGKLYISYTQGKEDCVLTIIPINCLAVDA